MDKWCANSTDHNIDIWVKDHPSKENAVLIRQREYRMYFSDRDLSIENDNKRWVIVNSLYTQEAKMIHTSCYNVEEWNDCPELLNKFKRVSIDIDDLEKTKQGDRDTNLYRDALSIAQTIPFPWFVRTSSASPKDVVSINRSAGETMKGFDDAFSAIYTIAISGRCNTGISHGFDKYMWIAPYRDISRMIHYRVFIRDCKVKAISQYDEQDPPYFPNRVRDDIISLWNRIEGDVWYEDCVMDVVHNEETGEILIIEFNEFGASSLAGSALYNWVQDMHILYLGDGDIRVNKSIE